MGKLDELREQIDGIDADIVALLNRRADVVLQVKAEKSRGQLDIYSPARERQIFNRVRELSGNGSFPHASLERVFSAIVSATRSLIGELAVAYVGPQYSYSHEAALHQFGSDIRFSPTSSVP